MTRKRVGTGLLEAFSEPCEHCNGRGVRVTLDLPSEPEPAAQVDGRRNRPLVTPGAPPSPALLAPVAAPSTSVAPAEPIPPAESEPVPSAPAQPEPVAAQAEPAAAALDADPVAIEDPVAEVPAAPEEPALTGPDPVADVVDDGRPQRRRRRATRP